MLVTFARLTKFLAKRDQSLITSGEIFFINRVTIKQADNVAEFSDIFLTIIITDEIFSNDNISL